MDCSNLVELRRCRQWIEMHWAMLVFHLIKSRIFALTSLRRSPRGFSFSFAFIRSHWHLGNTMLFTEIWVIFKVIFVSWSNSAMLWKPRSGAHRRVFPVLICNSFLLFIIFLVYSFILHDTTFPNKPTMTSFSIRTHLWFTCCALCLTLWCMPYSRFWLSWLPCAALEFIYSVTLGIIYLSKILHFIL